MAERTSQNTLALTAQTRGVYNEVGGRIVGSYLIVEFYKNTGSDPKLTGNNGEWVFTGDDIFIGIGVYITPASGT